MIVAKEQPCVRAIIVFLMQYMVTQLLELTLEVTAMTGADPEFYEKTGLFCIRFS